MGLGFVFKIWDWDLGYIYKKIRDLGSRDPRLPTPARVFKDHVLYVNAKAWMNFQIWEEEMVRLNQKLGKEKRKILMLSDNVSSHKKLDLNNIEFLFFMPGCTATLQVNMGVQ